MALDFDVAVRDILSAAETEKRYKLAEAAGYAEDGPTYDPSGNYLCGGCSFRYGTNKCAVVKDDISFDTGGCIIYQHGPSFYDAPLTHQFDQAQVIYTERPNVKGFGCKRCEYGKDEGLRKPHCIQWDFYVDPNACCYANEGKDDVIKAYGTSEGVTKAWDTRGRGRKEKEEIWRYPLYRGTTTQRLEEILKDGLVPAKNPMALDSLDRGSMVSQKGHVYATYNRGIAENYAKFKKAYNEAGPGEYFSSEGMDAVKPKDAPAAVKDTKPVIVTVRVPVRVMKEMRDDPDSPPHHDSYLFKGTIPKRYIDSIEVLDGGDWKKVDLKNKLAAESEDDMTDLHFVLDDLDDLDDGDVEAYGTSEGVEKAWDTRGRGQHVLPSGVDYRTKSGVHVGIFDRPEQAGENAISVTKFFKEDAPPPEDRIKIADAFEKAEPYEQTKFPIRELTPMQRTVTKDRLERGKSRPDPKPVSIFNYKGRHYLIDGHHRVAGESFRHGMENYPAVMYRLPLGVAAAKSRKIPLRALAKAYEIKKLAKREIRIRSYGTSEGVTKAWDTRGRGRKQQASEFLVNPHRSAFKTGVPIKLIGYHNSAEPNVIKEGRRGVFFAELPAMDYGSHIHRAEITLNNPLVMGEQHDVLKSDLLDPETKGELQVATDENEEGKMELPEWFGLMDRTIRQAAEAKGYDGIIYTEPEVLSRYEYQVFDSKKSVKNLTYEGDSWDRWAKKYPNESSAEAQLRKRMMDPGGDDWAKNKGLEAYGTPEGAEKNNESLHAESAYHGIAIEGFTTPQEEVIRATASRVPPELMFNVERIVSAPELGAKHGRYDPPTKTVFINPHEFDLRQRFGEGPGWIHHMELTMVHEFMHSIYAFLPELMKDEWRDLSGWMIGSKDGQAPAYVEKRPGWEVGKKSKWTHRKGIKFPRHYSERNDDEDFADCATYLILSKGHMVDDKKKAWIDKLFSVLVKKYPRFAIESPSRAYGERELMHRNVQAGSEWIGVDLDGTLAIWKGNINKVGPPIPKMLARVKKWLDQGKTVKIVTARVDDGDREQEGMIKAWTKKYLGHALEVTSQKDRNMVELWDDRARRVEKNTGELLN